MLPGTVNAHNHSFQSLLRGFGDDLPFLEWRDKALYRFSPRLGREGVYTGALFAFAEMALHGVTTVCDFFYLNDGGNDNARAVIAAARALGMRVVMARCFYDWDGAPKQYRETVAQAHEHYLQLHNEFTGARDVLVCPAPHSLARRVGGDDSRRRRRARGAPGRAGTSTSPRSSTRSSDARKKYGTTPLRAVDKMGLLGEDMVAVHGCWFDADERALLAERGAKLAYNPNSNMFLGDGITDVVDLVKRGAQGGARHRRRLLELARQRVRRDARLRAVAEGGARPTARPSTPRPASRMGTAWGGEVLGLPVGRLAVGQRADVVFVDLDDPSLWPWRADAGEERRLLAVARAPSPTSSSRARRSCATARSSRSRSPTCRSACARSRPTGRATDERRRPRRARSAASCRRARRRGWPSRRAAASPDRAPASSGRTRRRRCAPGQRRQRAR